MKTQFADLQIGDRFKGWNAYAQRDTYFVKIGNGSAKFDEPGAGKAPYEFMPHTMVEVTGEVQARMEAKRYYVNVPKGDDGVVELRQNRFKAQFEAGKEHPHDLCGVAFTVAQLRRMVINADLGVDNVEWPKEGNNENAG